MMSTMGTRFGLTLDSALTCLILDMRQLPSTRAVSVRREMRFRTSWAIAFAMSVRRWTLFL